MFVLVIPTYNERENIVKLVSKIDKLYAKSKYTLSILVADDSSPDGTREALETHLKKSRHAIGVEVITKKDKTGLKDAYFNAFRYALRKHEADIEGIIQMDADLSHDPKYLRKHLENLASGSDLSIGSRYVKGGGISNWGWSRIAMSRVGNMLNRVILSPKINDYTGGFNGMSPTVVKHVIKPGVVTSSGYYFLTVMKYRILKSGYIITEFPIIFTDRVEGDSKMGGGIMIEAVKQLFRIRFSDISK